MAGSATASDGWNRLCASGPIISRVTGFWRTTTSAPARRIWLPITGLWLSRRSGHESEWCLNVQEFFGFPLDIARKSADSQGGLFSFLFSESVHALHFHSPCSSETATRLHAHRTPGGDRHHRDPDRTPVTRGAKDPRGRAPDAVYQQPEAIWVGPPQLPRYQWAVAEGWRHGLVCKSRQFQPHLPRRR